MEYSLYIRLSCACCLAPVLRAPVLNCRAEPTSLDCPSLDCPSLDCRARIIGARRVDRLPCRCATRLNNDAVVHAPQDLPTGKSRKHLPQCTQMKGIYNTTLQIRSRLRDAGGAERRYGTIPHDMPHRDKVQHCYRNQSQRNTGCSGDHAREQRREPRSSEHADVKIAEPFRPA